MKKKLLLPLLLAGGLCSTPAFAETYVSGSVGLGMLGNVDSKDTVTGETTKDAMEFKSGVPFGVAFGYKFDEYRAEAAIGYQSHDADKWKDGAGVLHPMTGSASVLSFMANGYRDFVIKDSGVSPYVTAGFGLAKIKGEGEDGESTADKSVFAWQLGAGVGIKASDKVVVDLGYRYFKPSKIKSNDGSDESTLSISNFLAGVRYTF
ncbi:MAG: outer membrane protein [Chlorobium sp.]